MDSFQGPGTSITIVTKPCINKTWIALLINGFLSIKTWLLIACGTGIYAIMLNQIWAGHSETKWCMASEDTYQPAQTHSLIKVFALCIKNLWVLDPWLPTKHPAKTLMSMLIQVFVRCTPFCRFCYTSANNWATLWQNQQNGMCAQWSLRLRSTWAFPQSDQSLCS